MFSSIKAFKTYEMLVVVFHYSRKKYWSSKLFETKNMSLPIHLVTSVH